MRAILLASATRTSMGGFRATMGFGHDDHHRRHDGDELGLGGRRMNADPRSRLTIAMWHE